MTSELVLAIGFIILIVSIIGVGLWLAYNSGGDKMKTKQAKEDANEAIKQLDRRTDPVLSDGDYRARLQRAKDRLARMRNRETKL